MISHLLRCVYVHVPKTGGHSIDRHFLEQGLVSVPCWHATAAKSIELLEGRPVYYMFATVRNPWDRLVSEYFWQGSDCDTQIPTPWGNKTIRFEDYCRSDWSWYPPRERADGHLSDQAHFLFDDRDRPLVNDIIRFENLQEGFDRVCQTLGLAPSQLPRLNATRHEPYWRYYTDELVEEVARRYARDIRLLGYEFGA